MYLDNFKIIFWDFDGVIKDSVSVKTDAFVNLFKNYGKNISEKIRIHHLNNGGMSRYEKIPLYLEWSGIKVNNKNIEEFISKFGDLVKYKVIKSKWVPGVNKFIKENHKKFIFIIVSATPQEELISICEQIKIIQYFSKIIGSPVSKSKAIKSIIDQYNVSPKDCVMFGDSITDLNAAKKNDIEFILRRNFSNQELELDAGIKCIYDFHF